MQILWVSGSIPRRRHVIVIKDFHGEKFAVSEVIECGCGLTLY